MTVRPVPEGFHTITPNIIVKGADDAIAFLKRAFGAQEHMRLVMPNGSIAHCEVQIGDSRVNIGGAMDGWPAHALLAQIHVEDSDASFKRALEAGATVSMPMTDMFFGSREGRVVDPFGNTWVLATRNEDVSPAEMQRRLNEQAGGVRGRPRHAAARLSRSEAAPGAHCRGRGRGEANVIGRRSDSARQGHLAAVLCSRQ